MEEQDAKPGGKWAQGPPRRGTGSRPDTANISQAAAEELLNQSGDVPMNEAERRARRDGEAGRKNGSNRSSSRKGRDKKN